jgi:predicted RNA methylase
MYYRDPELFVRQAAVDRYIDDIAYTFGVGRDALNVVRTHSSDHVLWIEVFATGSSCKRLGCWSFFNREEGRIQD